MKSVLSKILVIAGVLLLCTAGAKDDMTKAVYSLDKLILLTGLGVVFLYGAYRLNRENRK